MPGCPAARSTGPRPVPRPLLVATLMPLSDQNFAAPLWTGVTTPVMADWMVIALAALDTECMNFSPSSE